MERSRHPSRDRSISGAARPADDSPSTDPRLATPPVASRRSEVLRAHGDERIDDYHWLRERDDPDVISYLEAENEYALAATEHLAGLREQIFEEIRSRVRESDTSVPAPWGPWAYYSRTVEGLQYRIHCRRPSDRTGLPDPDATPGDEGETVLLDENALAAGHEYFALGGLAVTPDHETLAYAFDTRGVERFTLRFRDLANGHDLDDEIADTSYGLGWANDGSTIFYTRPDTTNRPYQVWRRRLGYDDELVFEELDERFFVGLGRCRSGRFVVIAAQSKITSEVHLLDADDASAMPRLVARRHAGVEYHVDHHVDASGDRLFIVTNDIAPNFRLVVADLDRPDEWQEVIPGRDSVRLERVDAFSRHLVLEERAEALTLMRVLRLTDNDSHQIDLPDPVFTVGLGTNLEFDATNVRIEYDSLVRPPTTYDYDLETRTRTLVKQQPVLGDFDPDDYTSERLWTTAPDGVEVPISVVRRVDATNDAPGPCLVYGYGAYEISIDPTFSIARLSLLDRGVAFAIAHPRGGGELGRQWYEGGKLANKPNTFSDFLACADALVAAGYTRPEQLVARGGSAGGLLMGAVVNLRPDGFRAIVAEVPFVDCLTTMLDASLPLTVTEFDEWGDPASDPEVYSLMKSYSPYDNVLATTYPAMLVTAGINDPRVQYWEPAKWVAKLRATTTGPAPILLKTEMGAGHAGPSGRYDAWRDEAFVLAFVLDQLGINA
jgi:oligopeptidase B